MKAEHFRRLINCYPPFWAAGIRCTHMASDYTSAAVILKEYPWNRNLVGVHYGGSLFSMCDPWFMFLLKQQLGSSYVVWDQLAHIHFVKPGRGTVVAAFEVPHERTQEIWLQTQGGKKVLAPFTTRILDREGAVVAEVSKVCYVREKRSNRGQGGGAAPQLV